MLTFLKHGQSGFVNPSDKRDNLNRISLLHVRKMVSFRKHKKLCVIHVTLVRKKDIEQHLILFFF